MSYRGGRGRGGAGRGTGHGGRGGGGWDNKRGGGGDGGDGGPPKRQRSGDDMEDDFGEDFDLEEQIAAEMAAGEGEGEQLLPPEEYEQLAASASAAEAVSEAAMARWRRPAVPPIDPKTEGLELQWLDVDMTVGKRLASNPAGGKVPGAPSGAVPIVRFYGVTPQGNSCAVFVHGFTPYLYAACPKQFLGSEAAVRQALNARLLSDRQRGSRHGDGGEGASDLCLGVAIETDKRSILGYAVESAQAFFKIFVATPNNVPTVKRILDDGLDVPGFGRLSGVLSYESNVPFVLRFMIDKDITGAGWLECPAGTYALRKETEKESHCQLEVDIVYDRLLGHRPEGKWNKLAPLRILSFDIECQGRKGHFPEAEKDPVIQIANVLSVQGQVEPLVKNVLTLKGCLPIVGAQVLVNNTEEDLLAKWRTFVQEADPDIITGYNIANFDLPYLLKRADTLAKRSAKLKVFKELGRLKRILATMKDTTFQSSAYGKRENVETTIHGRVIFDLLPYMFRNHKLSSYSLNSVSAEFLGQQKEDVHHSIISDLQNGTDEDRRRLAVYCIKDALLPMKLMEKLSVLVNYVEMARVTGVPMNFLLTRGQQIKVFSMLLRKCRTSSLLIPNLAKNRQDESTYEGATVIEPKKAFYQEPIATLDFASLYPSIMQAYNLCYSTLVSREERAKLKPEDYIVTPSNECFVKPSVRKGILPLILDELLAARKRAKKDMAAATDPMEKAVQNGRQLALKVSANSVYGFTGATVGQLPCIPIASSVTSYGRDLLFQTKAFVEKHYTIENGFPYNAEVVYGDTDSVMVKFGVPTVEEAMPLAERAADEVTKIFPTPIKLEFEKVYCPYLLMNKKRYAGLLWTKPEKYDKMDTKGLETVRRDNCLLVRRVVDTCLRKILIERDVPGAISYCKGVIAELLQNKMDISLLVITKALGKSADESGYAAKQAHVELAMRMKKRDPGTAPNVGDRVAYVIIQAGKGAPAYERSEDPVYVLENNLPIDTDYYLQNQLSNPLTRLFEPIIDNPETLLTGDHTRTIAKPTPMGKGITMFAVKKLKCMGCKTPVANNDGSLCAHCKPREAEIYTAKALEVAQHEAVFNKLWTCCQRCQGSFHQDILCTNRDCPIFYKRKKVQKDLKDAHDALARFDF